MASETNESVSKLFGFTGKLFDKEFKLSNHWNRWYDPAIGKWISEDPIGFAAGDANLGRYVGNRVVAATDSLGLQEDDIVGLNLVVPQHIVDNYAAQEMVENYHNDGGSWDGYWAAWQGDTQRVDWVDSGLYYGGKGARVAGIGAGGAAAIISTGGTILAVGASGSAVTSTTVLTVAGGGAVIAYEVDVGQAALRSEISGHQVDSLGGGTMRYALGHETKVGQIGSIVYDNLNLLGILRFRRMRSDTVAPRRVGQSELGNALSGLGNNPLGGNINTLDEFGSGSAFSGVFDPASGKFLAYPSGSTRLANGADPLNLVPRRGGHSMVNDVLSGLTGANPRNNLGFTMFLDDAGDISVDFFSRGVNGRNPAFDGNVVPENMRQQILDAIRNLTGRNVTGS